MISYSSDVVIDRPLAQVASFAVDPDSHARWMGDVREVHRLDRGGFAVGSRFQYTIRKGPIAMEPTFRITAFEPLRRIDYAAEPGSPVDWTTSITFEAIDTERTRVRSAGRIAFRGVRRLLEPLITGEVRAGEAAELAALKSILESMPVTEPAGAPATA